MLFLSIEYKFSSRPTLHRLGHPLWDLLESLHAKGSIGNAAKHLGRSYRYVWGELKYWETELDVKLVVWGQSGKSVELTTEAIQYIKAMSKSQKELEQTILDIKKIVLKNTKILKSYK